MFARSAAQPGTKRHTPVNFVQSVAQNSQPCKTSTRADKIRRSRSHVRGISPSPPKLGELTAFSWVRHGFGEREAVPLAVGSLPYRRVNLPPCGVRGLCVAVARCFGYAEIAIEFSYIDERKQSRPSESSCAPLCEPLTDRRELYPCARCVRSGLSCVLSGFVWISDEP